MTLVISAINRNGAWQCSDRRLTTTTGDRVITDVATKSFRLGVENGTVLVSYSGIGGIGERQVSEWMKRLFRGQRLDYRAARNLLAAAATRRLTPRNVDHEFSICGFVDGHPLFEVLASDRTGQNWVGKAAPAGAFGSYLPRARFRRVVFFSGSGRSHLTRPELRLAVRTLKRRRLRPTEMEQVLVHLNRLVSERTATVGHDCICSYMDAEGGGWARLHDASGQTTIPVPTISGGLPMDEIGMRLVEAVGPEMAEALREERTPNVSTELDDILRTLDLQQDDRI